MLQLTPGLPFLHVPGPSPPGVGDSLVVVYAAPLTAPATAAVASPATTASARSGRSSDAGTRTRAVLIVVAVSFQQLGVLMAIGHKFKVLRRRSHVRLSSSQG